VGAAPTLASAPAIVSESVPLGMAIRAMSGAGWSCTSSSCTRFDSLVSGASYPPITVTVDVASNATSPLVNVAGISGGGVTAVATTLANDSTVIEPGSPVLRLVKSHSGSFVRGQTGTYTLTASNAGSVPTVAGVPLRVVDAPPAGMTLTAMSGPGWSCTLPGCTRSDSLPAGQSYPPITLTVRSMWPRTRPPR
jgi:uncharacterized repeat protein (TIGR01451 family)